MRKKTITIKAWVVWNKDVTKGTISFLVSPSLYIGDIFFTEKEAKQDWRLRSGKKGDLDILPVEITFESR